MGKKISLFIFCLLAFNLSHAQLLQPKKQYTRADSLRGGLRPERTNYDVLEYNLSVAVNPKEKYIVGNNKITFSVLHKLPVMQLDLFANMTIDSIVFHGQNLPYKREYNAVFITFNTPLQEGTIDSLDFYYSGHPIVAKRPPWDGGFIFTKDKNGKDWVSVAVQGTGASLWYPNKDTQSDEPERAEIHVTTPPGLMDVSNGKLVGKKTLPDGRTTWSWRVTYPINNYDLILNIGEYVHFSDKFHDLDLEYYVLPYNLQKAKKQFKQVKPMLACFTKKFGPYPFKRDSYKLVDAPFLGMEHQSAVAYGNHYKNGYLGGDLSRTGIGLKWDYIIVHESAHEWFGNSITAADIADMWIHEAFASYAESVYVECRWGKQKAVDYLVGTRKTMVSNDRPIIGDYGVNKEGSGDMYFKGANMLLTIRSAINNDKKWWKLLKNYYNTFKYQIINTRDVIHFFDSHSKLNLTPIFNQYLRYTALPELQFKTVNDQVYYRWKVNVKDFDMPVGLWINHQYQRIQPTEKWQKLKRGITENAIKVDTDHFYVTVQKQ